MVRFLPRFLLATHAAVILALAVSACTAVAADAAKTEKTQPAASGPGILSMLPADSTSDHELDVGHGRIAYTATAGTITLKDGKADNAAAIFYTAYRRKGTEAAARPVTFVFNGGPGAASVYLHLGLVGPRRADFGPRFDAANARLVPNPDSWLRFTDLVLVDPVGTGWSRAASDERDKSFWNTRGDAEALAKFVALYLARNGRMGSPKYLLGESYGGFRAVKLARALQKEQGIVVSGIVMISPFLDGALQIRSDRFALGAALMLPSIAAAEMDRNGRFKPDALKRAEQFALTDYLTVLTGTPPEGEAATKFYERVAKLSGLPLDVVRRARGFIADAYTERAGSDKDQVVSPYDASFAIPDAFPESLAETGSDPMLEGFLRGLGGLFVAYARDDLGYKCEMTYKVLDMKVNRSWDWGGGRAGASVISDLRELLALNPSFRLLIAHGRDDLVTPYGVSRYVLDHLPLAGAATRTQLRVYSHGHMFYLDRAARIAFTADAMKFYMAAPHQRR